jgi:hypothetical protein
MVAVALDILESYMYLNSDADVKNKIMVKFNYVNLLQFGKHLMQNGFARVCCLHRGIQVLRSTDILVVPGAM